MANKEKPQTTEVETPAEVNPFTKPIETPAPKADVAVAATPTPLAAHDQLWYDTKALIRSARRLGIDFEVLMRGALQEIEKGL